MKLPAQRASFRVRVITLRLSRLEAGLPANLFYSVDSPLEFCLTISLDKIFVINILVKKFSK